MILKYILFCAIYLFSYISQASHMHAIEQPVEPATSKQNIVVFWSAGYFAAEGKRRPKLGGDMLDDFVKYSVDLLKSDNYGMTLITTRLDWREFQKYLADIDGGKKLQELNFLPLFVGDMIYVMQNRKLPNGLESDDLERLDMFIKSDLYKEIAQAFYEKEKSFFISFKKGLLKNNLPLGEGLKSQDTTDPIMDIKIPDTINDPTKLMDFYFTFHLQQAYWANPSFASNFLRHFYLLACCGNKQSTYMDIDKFIHSCKKPVGFVKYHQQLLKEVDESGKQSKIWQFDSEIDLLVKNRPFSSEYLETYLKEYLMVTKPNCAFFIPYFHSTTKIAFESLQGDFFEKRIGWFFKELLPSFKNYLNNSVDGHTKT